MVELTDEAKSLAIEYAESFNNLHDKRYADHVTIQFDYAEGDILHNLHIDQGEDFSASLVGMTVQLKVVGYVYSPQVQALKVEPVYVMSWPVRGDKPFEVFKDSLKNEHPHVTISTSKEGRPVMSNGAFSAATNPDMVTDIYYRDVNGPILTGVICLYLNSGKRVFDINEL
jgi:hypothetical protein|tara:strand:+ start:502 stop:1014 length:513 start_codon:yes stop_codon:yes gene_type:complete